MAQARELLLLVAEVQEQLPWTTSAPMLTSERLAAEPPEQEQQVAVGQVQVAVAQYLSAMPGPRLALASCQGPGDLPTLASPLLPQQYYCSQEPALVTVELAVPWALSLVAQVEV